MNWVFFVSQVRKCSWISLPALYVVDIVEVIGWWRNVYVIPLWYTPVLGSNIFLQSFFPAMTKIVGTLGPKSRSVEIISRCLEAGMSGTVLFFVFLSWSINFHRNQSKGYSRTEANSRQDTNWACKTSKVQTGVTYCAWVSMCKSGSESERVKMPFQNSSNY